MYKIKQELADHGRAALEVEWVGPLAVPFGSIPAGGEMKAFHACFWSSGKGRLSGSGITIVSTLGSKQRSENRGSTAVLFRMRFCGTVLPLFSRKYAGSMGCVGKVRASHFRSFVLSL